MKLAGLILLLSGYALLGAEYYVDFTSGNDGNNGTSTGTAWKNLYTTTNRSFAYGDSILLKDDETWVVGPGISGWVFPTNGITLGRYGAGAAPVVDGNLLTRRVIDTGAWSNTVTDGIHIKNGGPFSGQNTGANWLSSFGTNTIKNCRVQKHATDAGVDVNGDAHMIVTNCFISDTFDDGATMHTTASSEIYGCTFSNCSQAISHSGTTMEMWVRNCIFTNNPTDIGPDHCVSDIAFCRFYSTGKILDGNATNVTFRYCIFDGRNASGVSAPEISAGAGKLVILNCDWYGAGNGRFALGAGANIFLTNCIIQDIWKIDDTGGFTIALNHCIHTNVTTFSATETQVVSLGNPQFVSVASQNFHLQGTSPAINAGVDVGQTLDFDGNFVGNPPDVGAYEYEPPIFTNRFTGGIWSGNITFR